MLNLFLTANSYFDNGGALFNCQYVVLLIVNLWFLEIDLNCKGKKYGNVTLTAYFPDYNDEDHARGYLDKNGKNLRTLQVGLEKEISFCLLSF